MLTPYFPFPLSHGGAVRIFHLLREAAREFDIVLYAFTEGEIAEADLAPVLEFVATRLSRQETSLPGAALVDARAAGGMRVPVAGDADAVARAQAEVAQVEYTYLASYGGDILVEHDVTCDLYAQVRARRKTFAAWWDWWRWRRFELRAVQRFQRVVVMSEKDRELLGVPNAPG